jgi:hypothetical protein
MVSKTACCISFVALIGSVGLQVYFSNNSAIKSNQMSSLAENKMNLEEQIISINREITYVSSLSNVEKLAREKGFGDMEGSLLVIKPFSVAMAR